MIRGTSVRDALDSATIPLRAAGVEDARRDAEHLLSWTMGIGRAQLLADPDAEVPGDAVRPFQDAVRRRREREPVAYITGRRGFRFIELAVDPRVLIPRPETELLVEVALGLPEGARVLDVCTGSGAVALALKQERPDLEVTGSDLSAAALDVARANATLLGLRVTFVLADLLDGLPGPWDAVLANPPYVEAGADLAPEITRYEPLDALRAGLDGLDVIRRLAPMVAGLPFVAIEVGAGQAAEVAGLLSGEIDVHRDLAGIERVVVARC